MTGTVNQLLPAIGARIILRCESLSVICRVVDAKVSYGQPRVQVEPESGAGLQWVEMGRIRPILPSHESSHSFKNIAA